MCEKVMLVRFFCYFVCGEQGGVGVGGGGEQASRCGLLLCVRFLCNFGALSID